MAEFDPDAFLEKTAPKKKEKEFDPDAFLKKTEPESAGRTLAGSSASLADTLLSIPGAIVSPVVYAGARAFGQSPEEAERISRQFEWQNPNNRFTVGNVTGTTESAGYQQAPQRVAGEFVGNAINQGLVDPLVDATGMDPRDAANVTNTMLMGVSPALGRGAVTTGKAVAAVPKVVAAVPDVVRGAGREISGKYVAPGTPVDVPVPYGQRAAIMHPASESRVHIPSDVMQQFQRKEISADQARAAAVPFTESELAALDRTGGMVPYSGKVAEATGALLAQPYKSFTGWLPDVGLAALGGLTAGPIGAIGLPALRLGKKVYDVGQAAKTATAANELGGLKFVPQTAAEQAALSGIEIAPVRPPRQQQPVAMPPDFVGPVRPEDLPTAQAPRTQRVRPVSPSEPFVAQSVDDIVAKAQSANPSTMFADLREPVVAERSKQLRKENPLLTKETADAQARAEFGDAATRYYDAKRAADEAARNTPEAIAAREAEAAAQAEARAAAEAEAAAQAQKAAERSATIQASVDEHVARWKATGEEPPTHYGAPTTEENMARQRARAEVDRLKAERAIEEAQAKTAGEGPVAPTELPSETGLTPQRSAFLDRINQHRVGMEQTRAENKIIHADKAKNFGREVKLTQEEIDALTPAERKRYIEQQSQADINRQLAGTSGEQITAAAVIKDMIKPVVKNGVRRNKDTNIVDRFHFDDFAETAGVKLDWSTAPDVSTMKWADANTAMSDWFYNQIKTEANDLGLDTRNTLKSQIRAYEEATKDITEPSSSAINAAEERMKRLRKTEDDGFTKPLKPVAPTPLAAPAPAPLAAPAPAPVVNTPKAGKAMKINDSTTNLSTKQIQGIFKELGLNVDSNQIKEALLGKHRINFKPGETDSIANMTAGEIKKRALTYAEADIGKQKMENHWAIMDYDVPPHWQVSDIMGNDIPKGNAAYNAIAKMSDAEIQSRIDAYAKRNKLKTRTEIEAQSAKDAAAFTEAQQEAKMGYMSGKQSHEISYMEGDVKIIDIKSPGRNEVVEIYPDGTETQYITHSMKDKKGKTVEQYVIRELDKNGSVTDSTTYEVKPPEWRERLLDK